MTQRNEVLAREANRISLICRTRAATQEDCLATTEREIPVETIEQTCIFEVGEETLVGRTTPKLVNTLVKITRWLNHLGSEKIADSCLEARQNVHHRVRINGMRL